MMVIITRTSDGSKRSSEESSRERQEDNIQMSGNQDG